MKVILSQRPATAQQPPPRRIPTHPRKSRELIQNHAYNVIGAASTLRAVLLGRMRPDISARELHRRRLVALAEITRSGRAIVALSDHSLVGGA